jgi:hypothetical protein
MAERGERGYRWPGGRAEPGVPVDGGIDPGIEDPGDDELIDWRDLAAIGQEQARLYALWRGGRIGNRAAKTGMALLARLLETQERVTGSRLVELEELVSRLEAQVALARPAGPVCRLA